MNQQKLLHINSSGRYQGSVTRQISDSVITQLQKSDSQLEVIHRDLSAGLPFVDEPWIEANFTATEERSIDQKETLGFSDSLVAELQHANHIVIASPIYNFSIPAVLKAWVDQIARANLTFYYTDKGPVGLLENKKATLVMASGGVPIESEMDLATPYLKQALAFTGISDVTVIDASTFNLKSSVRQPIE